MICPTRVSRVSPPFSVPIVITPCACQFVAVRTRREALLTFVNINLSRKYRASFIYMIRWNGAVAAGMIDVVRVLAVHIES
jgi:hypothetical protein